MKFSVLINCYNYSRYLGDCLGSVRDQTRPADEVIFVDDGSTDDSVDVAQRLGDELDQFRLISQENRGQLAAFERGVLEAGGDWLFFLDADDAYLPDHIERFEQAIAANPRTDLVFSRLEYFGEMASSEPYVHKLPYGDLGYATLFTLASFGVCVAPFGATVTSAVAIRAEIARQIFPFSRRVHREWRTRADDVLIHGCLLAGARRYALKEKTVRYRVHGANAFAGKTDKELNKVDRYGAIARVRGELVAKLGLDTACLSRLSKEWEAIPNRNSYLKKFYQHVALCAPMPIDWRLKNWWKIRRGS